MLFGLIFRESAKDKRRLRSWRDEKSVLPTSASVSPPSFRSSLFGGRKADPSEFGVAREVSGKGFGRQGEKQAGLKGMLSLLSACTFPTREVLIRLSILGFLITKPVEALPRYATRPASEGSLTSIQKDPNASMFRSSPTAL